MASLAILVGQRLAPAAGVDSLDMLPALIGHSPVGRTYVNEDTKVAGTEDPGLTKSGSPIVLALVSEGWKLISAHGTAAAYHGNVIGTAPKPQLFHLATDPAETRDLAERFPERVRQMAGRLEAYRAAGRTGPA